VLPPRQREEARALFARALALVADGGRIVACQSNNEGARSGEGDLKQLAGLGGSLTKNHCRVLDRAACRASTMPTWPAGRRWMQCADHGRPLPQPPGRVRLDRIDPASALLAEHLPADLAVPPTSAPVTATCRASCWNAARITALDLYEAEQRALALAELNLAPPPRSLPLRFLWRDVTAGIEPGYDVIISNPPFHTPSRADRPDIGQRFIAVAAQALRPGGRLYVVANRHLPYEHTSTTASARCAWSPSATASSWLKR
jgi:16S rRNA (guanine1207-N2)-methyltransferase